jgi:hypothetical protein
VQDLETDRISFDLQNIGILFNNLAITLPEAVTLSIFAFNASCCSQKNHNIIQKKVYKIFMENYRYDLAILSLRALLSTQLNI